MAEPDADPPEVAVVPTRYFLGGIPEDVTQKDLEARLASFGVTEVELIQDPDAPGRHKGFAFLTMPDAGLVRKSALCAVISFFVVYNNIFSQSTLNGTK